MVSDSLDLSRHAGVVNRAGVIAHLEAKIERKQHEIKNKQIELKYLRERVKKLKEA